MGNAAATNRFDEEAGCSLRQWHASYNVRKRCRRLMANQFGNLSTVSRMRVEQTHNL
jgi:hypothetical protein